MSELSYDGNRLIPAPLVTIVKQYQKTADQTIIGQVFDITLKGTLAATKGSPNSSGIFWTQPAFPPDETVTDAKALGVILRKQEALRQLFAYEGRTLVIQSDDGSQPLKCNPRINNIDFGEGTWYYKSDYTINMQADSLNIAIGNPNLEGSGAFPSLLSEINESWQFETDEGQPESDEPLLQRTYRFSHTIGAVGKRSYDGGGSLISPAWKQAQTYVLGHLGNQSTFGNPDFPTTGASSSISGIVLFSSGVNNLPSYYGGYNYIRNQSIDEKGGKFEVVETWLLASGSVYEDFDVQYAESITDGLKKVSVHGQITGLEQRDNNLQILTTKFINASGKLTALLHGQLLQRAQTYSGFSLNKFPLNQAIGYNPVHGIITYNFDYDNRPYNAITGARSEVINITNSFDVDVIAAVGVLGRLAGPVLQAINTHQPTTRGLNIEVVFGPDLVGTGNIPSTWVAANPRFNDPQKTDIQNIINAVDPIISKATNNIGKAASTEFISKQDEVWNPKEGRYVYNIEWIYE